jgi:hypothetical protein
MTGPTKTIKRVADKPKVPKQKAPKPKAAALKLAPDTSDVWRTDSLLKVMITQLDELTTAINDLVAALTPG